MKLSIIKKRRNQRNESVIAHEYILNITTSIKSHKHPTQTQTTHIIIPKHRHAYPYIGRQRDSGEELRIPKKERERDREWGERD